MKIGSFKFNLRELAGSMGDFGTLFPLAIGYIVVCGLNPAGLLVMMGVVNIATGIIYKLPMPVEPKKAVAVYAIANHWPASMVYSCGFSLGLFWLILSVSGLMERFLRLVPGCVIRGIQVSLGIMLGLFGFSMIKGITLDGWGLGALSFLIIILLRENRFLPASLVLVTVGVLIPALRGDLAGKVSLGISLPSIFIPDLKEMANTFILVGIAQIPLTLTNATIATAALIKEYFPDRPVSEKRLLINQAVMNLATPFFGGMPMCHGAGGLAGQYYFGARTGGTNIIEGLIEISLGLFLSSSIVAIFSSFPQSIIGAMLIMVGVSLLKFAKDVKDWYNILPMGLTIAVSVWTKNMAIGFGSGLVCFWLARRRL